MTDTINTRPGSRPRPHDATFRSTDKFGRPAGIYLGGEYLRHLLRNEEATAELYTAFAGALPGCREFWEALATEESAHANVVRTLKSKMDAGTIPFTKPRFNIASIRDAVAWAEDWRDAVRENGITMPKALELALNCEKTMIEANFFSVTTPDTPEMAAEIDALRRHTVEHIERLEHESKRIRWRFAKK